MKRKILSLLLALCLLAGTFISAFPVYVSVNEAEMQDTAAALTAEESSILAEKVLISSAKVNWKYLADGTDPAVGLSSLHAWAAPDFDDSAWQEAQAPFGNKKGELGTALYSVTTPKTLLPHTSSSGSAYKAYFFRKEVEITSLDGYNALYIDVVMDDAIVLYINGTEVFNSCVPTSEADTTNLYASESTIQQKQFRVYFKDYENLLKVGTNVIAAELHSGSATARTSYFALNKLSLLNYQAVPVLAETVMMTPGTNETAKNLAWYSDIAQAGEVRVAEKREVKNGVFPAEYTAFSAKSEETKVAFEKYAKKTSITGLKENTEYAYVIAAGDKVSKIYYFNTGSFGAYDFVFVGDPQISTAEHEQSWSDSLDKIINTLGADFIISAGDQINSPDSEKLFSYFIKEDLAGTALAPTVGPGHESPSAAFGDHYNLPNLSEEYGANSTAADYWYTYGNTLFMHLNVSDSYASANGEHEQFMKAAIAANPDATWRIVVMHHSLYSTANHAEDSNILAAREALCPVFTELGIDMVLAGHDHVYVRTKVLDGTVPTADAVIDDTVACPSGVVYICANSSTGSKHYSQDLFDGYFVAKENYEKRKSAIKLVVTDTSITMVSYFLDDMTVFDTFTIRNTSDAVLSDNVYVSGKSVSLGELIDMNLYIKTVNGYTGTATVTCGDKTVEIDLATLTPDEEGRYKLSIPLSAIDMTKTVTLNIDGGAYTTCIKKYAEELMLYGTTEYVENIAKALLNFGAYAQEYFAEKNSDNSLLDLLANDGLKDTDKALPDITAADLERYKFAVTGESEDACFLGTKLVLTSKTAIKLYFKASSDATVTVDGVPYEKQSEGGMYYVTLTVHSPALATTQFKVELSDGEVNACARFSLYSVIESALINTEKDEKLKNLLIAYAAYCDSTIAYSYAIIYELGGGSLPENAPTEYDPSISVTLPYATKSGYVFVAWYTTPTFDEGTGISIIPEGSVGQITVYARYLPIVSDFNFSDYDINLENTTGEIPIKNANDKNVSVMRPKSGTVFKTLDDGQNGKYLLWVKGTEDPDMDFKTAKGNGMAELSAEDNCVSFVIKLSLDGNADCISTQVRLRINKNVSGTSLSKKENIQILLFDKTGNINLVNNGTSTVKVATLEAGKITTLRLVVDFNDCTTKAYDEGGNILGTAGFKIPASTLSGATSGIELKDCITQNLLYFYAQKGSDYSADSALRIYGMTAIAGNAFAI